MDKFIPVAVPCLAGNEKKYVNDCLDTTWISSNGKYIGEFESRFAAYIGTREAVACCNGTVALHLALLALGIKEGDEVIVPSFTYIATANAVRYCGATPVFADSLADTWNMDPAAIRKKITPKTKAIIPVHLYGNPCDMDAVMAIAKEYGLFVVEDAAECHGAIYGGRKAGAIGTMGVFSFFGNKIITTGEGGMIVTDDAALAQKMRLYRGQGMDPKKRYWFDIIGYNYRMTNIEAALGLAQLEGIDRQIAARGQVAQWYIEELADLFKDGVLVFQKTTANAENVWWMFSVLLTDRCAISRDVLMEKMQADGVETRPLFYPMHVMPPYLDESAGCEVAEDIAARGLNLPTHALLARGDVAYICSKLRNYIKV
ncbi:MAG TPA: aminotransferase DegT [Clostridiales bacterium]|nr:aminotransferase DegT [Clostridiales bacterium]